MVIGIIMAVVDFVNAVIIVTDVIIITDVTIIVAINSIITNVNVTIIVIYS